LKIPGKALNSRSESVFDRPCLPAALSALLLGVGAGFPNAAAVKVCGKRRSPVSFPRAILFARPSSVKPATI
jgi:hypothetical protein